MSGNIFAIEFQKTKHKLSRSKSEIQLSFTRSRGHPEIQPSALPDS